MKESSDIRVNVYEVGYLLVSSIPEEQVPTEVDAIRTIITKAGASIITEEAPHLTSLAYTMRKKMVSGAYHKYDKAHFGWIKFEVSADQIENIKKEIEIHPTVLRTLMISTVKENTFLGKRAAILAEELSTVVKKADTDAPVEAEKAVVPPASIEDMDKSIDALVKEA